MPGIARHRRCAGTSSVKPMRPLGTHVHPTSRLNASHHVPCFHQGMSTRWTALVSTRWTPTAHLVLAAQRARLVPWPGVRHDRFEAGQESFLPLDMSSPLPRSRRAWAAPSSQTISSSLRLSVGTSPNTCCLRGRRRVDRAGPVPGGVLHRWRTPGARQGRVRRHRRVARSRGLRSPCAPTSTVRPGRWTPPPRRWHGL